MRVMAWLGVWALLLGVCPTGAAEEGKGAEGGKLDAAKLVGTWKYVSGVTKGQKVDPERLKGQTVTITKETITLKGEETFVMKYELGTGKEPVSIKMTITESPFGAGATASGIIALDGDELKLCYAPEGGEAPTKFEAKEGSGYHLFVLKKSK